MIKDQYNYRGWHVIVMDDMTARAIDSEEDTYWFGSEKDAIEFINRVEG